MSRLRFEKNERGYTCVLRTPEGERRIPTGTHNKAEAEAMGGKWKKRVEKGIIFDRRMVAAVLGTKNIQMPAAIEQWAESKRRLGTLEETSIAHMKTTLLAFVRESGLTKQTPACISEEHVAAYVNGPEAGKENTRQFKLDVLKVFVTWCENKGFVFGNPARAVGRINKSVMSHEQKETRHKTPFTPEEIAAVLGYIDNEIHMEQVVIDKIIPEMQMKSPRGHDSAQRIASLRFWKAAVVISLNTGLRLGDVACLEHASLGATLIKHTQKSNKRVEIPMCDELSKVVASLPKLHEHWVFPVQAEINNDVARRALLPKQFGRICRSVGIEGKTFHCLRAGHAVNLKQAGASMEEVQARLGHSHPSTTQVYLPPATVAPASPTHGEG